MKLKALHHIAIICSDYQISKQFYTKVLGFEIQQEVYRKERDSYKLDLVLNGTYLIELFSFPNPKASTTKTPPWAPGRCRWKNSPPPNSAIRAK